jgi:uncharacterized RDD family membrane protein YckC
MTEPDVPTQPSTGGAAPEPADVERPVPDARHAAALAVPREARPYQGQRAGIVTRVIANTIDVGISAGVVLGCWVGYAAIWFLLNPVGFTWPTFNFLLFILATGAVMVGYFTIGWATSGRTVGDQVMGLRVVNHAGERLRWAGAFVRAVFCTLLPIGLFWILVSPTNRTVQDTVMRTSCIYDWIDRPLQPRGEERAAA